MRRGRFDIAGRTVFITGAARGIGAATAQRLHGHGANVALVGLEPELLEALAARLGDRAAFFEADVTDSAALERAVAGTVDRAVLDEIVARRGYLLNISSLSAVSHAPLMGPYSAAKAGVEALTDCLRVETAPSGARVGCAYFGFIDTDLVRASFAHPSTQLMMRSLPSFIAKPAPLERAIDAIERGIQRRAARVWAPRYIGPMLALRGVLQPLAELRVRRSNALHAALALVEPERDDVREQDAKLGIAARIAMRRRPTR